MKTNEKRIGVPINLQLFSEAPPTLTQALDDVFAMKSAPAPEPTVQTTPAGTTDTPGLTPPQTEAPAQTTEPAPDNQPQVGEPAHAAPATQPDLGHLYAGKYKTPEALEEGYRNVNSFAARTLNEKKALEEKLARLEQERTNPQPTPPAYEPDVPDDINDKFYADPKGTLKELLTSTYQAATEAARAQVMSEIDGKVAERVAPVLARHEQQAHAEQWAEAMTQYETDHPDFADVWPEMESFIKERGLQTASDKIAAMEDAYLIAKGRKATSAPATQPAPTVEQLLADEGFLNKILENEAIRNRILTDQVAKTRQQQGTLPRHIPEGGVSTAVPPSAPSNMQEARRYLSERLQRHQE